METAQLKSFATAARTELIREVGARITAVLAQGSPERVEQPKAVTALERAIAGADGGDKGKAHVADKVAYTWFNRIVALRFMDANGYTGIGVVSPATDQVGQPEVLAAAKRGQLDTDVVKGSNPATITGLLNGTRQPRPGVDAQAEAYALLLADYCRFWNTAMPFMFEREGDYTELLIPANLLADDSVLSRSVTVLTEDVCHDVEVIGWLYQFYISERKDEVFAGFKKNKKAGADELPAATQLFTPHWIVRYLVENSLGRLWMLNRPSSGLASQMDYYIAPVDEETDFLKVSKPEELKVVDPACGSGHMLTYAFDLLYAIYEEEGYAPSEIPSLILAHNLYGTEIDPRAGALAAFALTMKASAKRKLFLRNPVEPNICVIDPISFSPDELDFLVTKGGDKHAEEAFWNQFAEADTLGALIKPDPALISRLAVHLGTISDDGDIYKADALDWAWQAIRQAEFLSPKYSVVVANPPYMGSKNLDGRLSAFAKQAYPLSKADLFSMFIERCLSLASPGGMVGMITMHSWMFLSTYEKFRESITKKSTLVTMAHLGPRAFDSIAGEVVATAAFVRQLGSDVSFKGSYLRLVGGASEAAKRSQLLAMVNGGADGRYEVSADDLARIPGAPVAYWASDSLRLAFKDGQPLGDIAEPKSGLSTTDNQRFLRRWFEVSRHRMAWGRPSREAAMETRCRWFPYNKGGDFRQWYGNHEYVVNWEGDGREIRKAAEGASGGRIVSPEYYFRDSVSWSKVSTGRPAFRRYPQGFIFDVGGTSMFVDGPDMAQSLLGLGNSAIALEILGTLSPTFNFEVGQIARIPVLGLPSARLVENVDEIVDLARADWDSFERSIDFQCDELVRRRNGEPIAAVVAAARSSWASKALRMAELIAENDALLNDAYGFDLTANEPAPVTLDRNEEWRYGDSSSSNAVGDLVEDLVSYAVGCILGRYSLDEPGLILADQGATLDDYLVRVPSPTITPDADNVIPVVDGDWFEDDIVGLFRQFLRTAFGDQHFEENLKFVTESLGVKNLRDYFITRAGRSRFYDDHVQRYKKRPIYWLFSSPKGSFNALIYMHRYTPSTVSTVLTYLREYVTKLESSLQQAERAGNAKEADRLRMILVELNEYEHDTLYPKASENVVIDLDDGVKTNYPKFGTALKKITGLEAAGD